jgi:hypothetical protein
MVEAVHMTKESQTGRASQLRVFRIWHVTWRTLTINFLCTNNLMRF